jgi:hypothetical protein
MRTRLILTAAAIGVAGSMGALAQVYSVNAVGFINKVIPANSLAIIANQLTVGGNTINEVIPTAPDGTIVYNYTQAGGFAINGREFGAWTTPTADLKPGSAFFIANNAATPLTITFVGEVPQGSLSTPLLAGLNLVASQVPQAGALTAALGYTPADGDQVYQWDAAINGYKAPNGFEFGAWSGGDPALTVAEGFFLSKAAAGAWARTFSVN